MGSITSWIRLEPRCRDDDMTEAVHARVYDPLWMLARQWQTGEFQAEDTGTPVVARWRAHSAPITRYFAGAIKPDTSMNAPRYDARVMPLEALVERQPLRNPTIEGSLRLAVESGLHFLRMLDAQPMSRSYRSEFLGRFVLQPPTDDDRASLDTETLSYWNLMALRAPDARRLINTFGDAEEREAVPESLGVVEGDRAEVAQVIESWLAQHNALFNHPQADAPDAWNPERLEYAFSLGGAPRNELEPGLDEVSLTATQYAEGHLDWHSVDYDMEINLGSAKDNANVSLVRALIPAPVNFRGAPAQRFWELEDAAIDYGLLPAGPGDLPHLMLSDFATNFGNDWYVIPIELNVGTLTRTRSLVITDSFGVQTLIAPINNPSMPASGWSMFELSTLLRGAAEPPRPKSNLFFLAPSLVRTLDSRPLEEVLFLRDEMANMAWAVERVVAGPIEQRIELGAAADPPQTSLVTPSAVPRFRLGTDVPGNWTPLLPQRNAADGSLRLVCASFLAPDGSNVIRDARGELLKSTPDLALFNAEVPREGVCVTRQFEHTRWLGGSTLLWIGLRKQAGRGEGSSALRFDEASE